MKTIKLKAEEWLHLEFKWNGLTDTNRNQCELLVDGKAWDVEIPLRRKSENGICYVHFISEAVTEDYNGFYIESIQAAVE